MRNLIAGALCAVIGVGVISHSSTIRSADAKAAENDEGWIAGDYRRARAAAIRTDRPMLVVFRCVP